MLQKNVKVNVLKVQDETDKRLESRNVKSPSLLTAKYKNNHGALW